MTFRRHTKRVLIAVAGGLVVLLGIVAIPYPGPGWLIVFLGFGILASEFAWAQRVLDYIKGKYDGWQEWLRRQPRPIQWAFLLATAVVVIVTVWLLNGYGFVDSILHLHQPWAHSPIPFFK